MVYALYIGECKNKLKGGEKMSYTITLILMFLVKVLFVLFVAGLFGAIIIAVKKVVFTQEDIQKIKSTFGGRQAEVAKATCVVCNKPQNQDWKVCPFCGTEQIPNNI